MTATMTTAWQTVTPEPCELGESPFWHPQEQMLYWIDIHARQLLRANVFMGTVERWAMPQDPGCIAPAKSGGLVVALRDGIYRAREWGGELVRLAAAAHDPATTRFNDGKADALGRFWASTIYEPRDRAAAELFCLDSRRAAGGGHRAPSAERKAGGATVGNGLAWSPDAATLYWSDTTSHRIRAWDWQAASNTLENERVFHQFAPKPAGWKPGQPGNGGYGGYGGYGGRPDGAAVDVNGNYWVAMFEGARLLQLSPAGEVLADIPVPAQCPTMPCFGGDDGRTLYLTTARHGRPAEELARLPLSGCVLALRVEVPGLAANFFVD